MDDIDIYDALNNMDEKTFEKMLIEKAEAGDDEAGREILKSIALAIMGGRFDSQFFPFLADCLFEYLDDGISLERALCVEAVKNEGGKPAKYDKQELAAVAILLIEHMGYTPAQAKKWISREIGAGRTSVEEALKEWGPTIEKCSCVDLLHLTGSLRRIIGAKEEKEHLLPKNCR